MMVSVLICTYNRPSLLAQALRSLLACNPLPGEIVVVNGGDNRTDAVVAPHLRREDVAVRLIKTKNRTLAASRNVGLPQCRGEILAITDDDAEVFPDWIAQIRRAHATHPEAGAVGGPVIGAGESSLMNRLAGAATFPRAAGAGYVRTLPGVNAAYKRAAVEAVGAQDESLFRGEDVDYNWRVTQAGYKLFFDPAIRVYHHHRPTLRQFLNQHYMYGRAYYLVRRKWPEMYCVYPHALRRPKDWAKAVNFVMAPLYQPILSARAIQPASARLPAVPLLFLNELVWRGGMVQQKLLTARSGGYRR